MANKINKLDKSKNGWGGRREGAGRKVLAGNENSRKYSFVAGGELGDYLDSIGNRSEFIKESLRHAIAERNNREEQELKGMGTLGDVIEPVHMDVVKMPMFDVEVACGLPIDVNNNEPAEMVYLSSMICPHPEHCYMIRAKGESMRDVNIHTGDLVIVDRDNCNPTPTDVAVCELNGEYTLKHFVRRSDGCWLLPENEEFSAIPVRDGDRLNIWGVVKTVIHNM